MQKRARVANIQIVNNALGYGKRVVVWLQGCLKHCPHCISPQYLNFEDGSRYTPKSFAEMILTYVQSSVANGITFSGGEPLLQWQFLKEASIYVKSIVPYLDIMVYTGYAYDRLTNRIKDFPSELPEPELDFIDILIDGEFQVNNSGSYLLKGSSNQTIYTFTKLGKIRLEQLQKENQLKHLQVFYNKDLFIAGIPNYSDIKIWENELLKKGISFKVER